MPNEQLLGLSEIAAAHKIAYNTAWRWSRRADFPAPALRVSAGPLWRKTDVDRWAERLPLKPGPKPRR